MSISDAQMNAVSDEVAENVFARALASRTFTSVDVLAVKDAQSAAQRLFGGVLGGWAKSPSLTAMTSHHWSSQSTRHHCATPAQVGRPAFRFLLERRRRGHLLALCLFLSALLTISLTPQGGQAEIAEQLVPEAAVFCDAPRDDDERLRTAIAHHGTCQRL